MVNEGEPPKEPRVRRYRPLDVRSWREGWLTILGWILVPAFAIISTVLFYMYEMKYINISDRDVRDLYMDQRLMNAANNYNHKFFINGLTCCNPDPVVFGEPSWGCNHDFGGDWNTSQPYCPPLIQIECPGSLVSTACNQTRNVLYPLLGMDPVTGAYTDCARAGLLLVGATAVSLGQPLLLSATYNNTNVGRLTLGTPGIPSLGFLLSTPPRSAGRANNNISSKSSNRAGDLTQPEPHPGTDASDVAAFVASLLQKYGSTDYVNPNVKLSKAFSIGGAPIQFFSNFSHIDSQGGKKTVKPWPFPIFNWPGAFKGRCPNTSTKSIWYMKGEVSVSMPAFNYLSPASMVTSLNFLNDMVMVSPWRVQPIKGSDTVDHLTTNVSLQHLTNMTVHVGMVPDMGACQAWLIDDSPWGTSFNYSERWQGPLSELVAGNPFTSAYTQNVTVTVYDTAEPMLTQLPFYGGMWYIVLCFGMAAVFAFTLGPFIVFALPLLWWNVRSNRGLPPVVYRYMKKYRGW